MKSITIEIVGGGAGVQLILPPGVSYAQAVVVTDDEVDIRVAPIVSSPPARPTPASKPTAVTKRTVVDYDLIVKRLRKLNTTNRVGAINSIKAMFQFDSPINEDTAAEILDDLKRRGSLSMDEKGKITFPPENKA